MVNNLQKGCFLLFFYNLGGFLVRCSWQFRTILEKKGHENSRRLSDFTFIETE